MEATARVPGTTATPTGTGNAGGHIHQLIRLAAALTTAATSTAAADTPAASTTTTATAAAVSAVSGIAAAGAGAGAGAPTAHVPEADAASAGTPLGVEVGALSDVESLGWARDLEALSRVLAALQVQAAGDLAARAATGRFDAAGSTSPADHLTTVLRISRAEANRRLRLAKHFLPATNPLTTVTTPCDQPILGAAFFAGTLSQELALMASSYTQDAHNLATAGRIPVQDANRLEATLASYARTEGPDFLRPVASHALDLLDPDGQAPTTGELTAKQGLFFRQPRRGLIHYDGYLTIAQYETLMAAIGWATNPNHHKDINTLHTDQPTTTKTTGGNTPNPTSSNNPGHTPNGSNANNTTELPGQTNLLDLLHTAARLTPATATSWPPKQGPPPNWAQPTPNTTTTTNGNNDDDDDANATRGETSGSDRNANEDGPGNGSRGDNGGTRGDNGGSDRNGNEDGPGNGTRGDDDGGNAGDNGEDGSWIFPDSPPPAGIGWQLQPKDTTTANTDSDAAAWIFPEPPPPADTGGRPRPADTNSTSTSTSTTTGSPETPGTHPTTSTTNTGTETGTSTETGTGAAEFWATPGMDPSPTTSTDGTPTTSINGTAPGPGGMPGTGQPWPHLIEGIRVPEPGSSDQLAGLDPIDPASTNPATADRRTYPQQLLDGLIDTVRLAARTGLLPVNGGMKPQLLISTTEADLQASRTKGTGCPIAFLPYTGTASLQLFDTELCDADVTTTILGNGNEILNAGRTQRHFTDAQRKILIARDIGCTFPHCTRPAAWCDAHHIIPWQNGGETNISNAALLCAFHHTLIHKGHWTLRLKNGTPYYTPAYNIDPQRQELRNTYHHAHIPTSP